MPSTNRPMARVLSVSCEVPSHEARLLSRFTSWPEPPYRPIQVSGISTTSGAFPPATIVASFSKAWPHGREIISTFTSGLLASKAATVVFSVSVLAGLVMTSTSLRFVSARTGVAPSIRPMLSADISRFIISSLRAI